jgi:hypothetical protein
MVRFTVYAARRPLIRAQRRHLLHSTPETTRRLWSSALSRGRRSPVGFCRYQSPLSDGLLTPHGDRSVNLIPTFPRTRPPGDDDRPPTQIRSRPLFDTHDITRGKRTSRAPNWRGVPWEEGMNAGWRVDRECRGAGVVDRDGGNGMAVMLSSGKGYVRLLSHSARLIPHSTADARVRRLHDLSFLVRGVTGISAVLGVMGGRFRVHVCPRRYLSVRWR